jgi:H+/Cl- antiporter ClcA
VSRSQRYLTFAAAILVTGVLSGVVGGFTTVLVRTLEHLSFGYDQGPLLIGVKDASIERRLIGLAIGCALAGLGWWLLRRKTSVPGLNESIRQGRRFSQVPMAIDALLQVLAVGSGASLGREQAPRLFAAAATELTIRSGSIPAPYRRILLASAAGAGLAAVYNVPAAGALYACGIVLRSWRPVAVLVAVATSCIATVTAWPVSHGHPTFVWPDTQYSWTSLLFTVALMPVAAAVGTGFNGLIRRAQPKSPPASWTLLVTIGLAGLLTGACSIWMPQMPGNGKSIIVESLAGGDTLIAVTVAMVLKPVLTALFIRAGAVGGMLTPSLATGVATGASIALLVERLGGYASVPTLALIGGAAVLGITQRAPVFATVFTAELTHPPPPIWGMLLLAAVGAHWVRLLAARRRRPAKPDRAPPHFKHCQHRLAWHDVAIGRRIVLAGSVAGTVAAVAAAMAVGIAPIAAAAPSEQHCLEQHCLAAEAPTIRQGPANVQIVTSPKAMPAVFPHTNNPKWRGLGYNARWPTLGHNPKWQDFGYSPRWNGFQTALLPDPGISLPEVEGPRPLRMRNNNQ